MMDADLKEIFAQVENYLRPILSRDPSTNFSGEESRILALQQINRLNRRIGQIARSSKEDVGEMKILQTFVNRLTVGVKTDNLPQIRGAMASVRSYIEVGKDS
jgi:hypothetical protein